VREIGNLVSTRSWLAQAWHTGATVETKVHGSALAMLALQRTQVCTRQTAEAREESLRSDCCD
jgi:hypothetical protein